MCLFFVNPHTPVEARWGIGDDLTIQKSNMTVGEIYKPCSQLPCPTSYPNTLFLGTADIQSVPPNTTLI